MSVHNILIDRLRCPRCGEERMMELETFFGFGNLFQYRVGDNVKWVPGNVTPKNGGRPGDGNMVGEGYAECPTCGKDFWVNVIIRSDTIERIEPNANKNAYIPD